MRNRRLTSENSSESPPTEKEMHRPRSTCVVSIVTGPKFGGFSDQLIRNKQTFCEQVRYECYIYNIPLVAEKRPLAWQKVYAIDAVLHMNNCRRLLWLDGDTIIMHPVQLPDMALDITLTKDSNGINTGVMIIKNTKWAHHFFS